MIIKCKPPEIPLELLKGVDQTFIPKQEYHLTLIPWSVKKDNPNLESIAEGYLDNDADFFKLTYLPGQYYYCERRYEVNEFVDVPHTRRSIVQAVDCPGMDVLYAIHLQKLRPFPHVTLFVGCLEKFGTNWRHGIEVISADEVEPMIFNVEQNRYEIPTR